ncbi:diaminobutyrate--2-oxoglutarate transaminase [Pseudonocardiaceae bacterium YIM PH 21723]|nr:diaminobutyrate--2-oxoglutarate transaminase [Pseudonocardiaceae bacterium YIM PH 21723]
MNIFETLESEVRGYCRSWPEVFDRATDATLYSESGKKYVDFFAGAGSLNYGHNNKLLKQQLIDYISSDRITHGLDMHTVAKREFLETFQELILKPRELDYKVQFPGPTGTNAVESALKLARKVTGREAIVSFTNGFHGMTLGSLAVSGDAKKRAGAGVPLVHSTPMPYDNFFGGQVEDFIFLEKLLTDGGSGLNKPAAVILETLQGEGGIKPARYEWIKGLTELCKKHNILVIVDDVQMGCGRTGPFFSFEPAGITPDIVCLSKSIGGYGLPMALTLIRRDLDVWSPGEHNGTFRGNNPAFVTATAALRNYWSDDTLQKDVERKGERVGAVLSGLAEAGTGLTTRGRGLARGLVFEEHSLAQKVASTAFEAGLLVETCGPNDEVVKLMPPLTISDADLEEGLKIFSGAVTQCTRN